MKPSYQLPQTTCILHPCTSIYISLGLMVYIITIYNIYIYILYNYNQLYTYGICIPVCPQSSNQPCLGRFPLVHMLVDTHGPKQGPMFPHMPLFYSSQWFEIQLPFPDQNLGESIFGRWKCRFSESAASLVWTERLTSGNLRTTSCLYNRYVDESTSYPLVI